MEFIHCTLYILCYIILCINSQLYNGILFSSAKEGTTDSCGNMGKVQNTVLRKEAEYERVCIIEFHTGKAQYTKTNLWW